MLFRRLTGNLFNAKVEPKIIESYFMNTEIEIENQSVSNAREWAIGRVIHLRNLKKQNENANALLSEFEEWINIPEGTEELDFISLEIES